MPQPQVSFEIVQRLDPEGRLTGDLPAPLETRENLVALYRSMVLTRLFDREAINLQRTGALGTYPSGEGQEAIGAGVGMAMRGEDVLVPYYRDIATQIQRGVLLEEILRYWGGDEWGMHYREQAEDFPVSVPIATQVCHAAGAAYAFRLRGEARVAVCFLGDGATTRYWDALFIDNRFAIFGALQLEASFR